MTRKPPDDTPVRIQVVDRRHRAEEVEGAGAGERLPTFLEQLKARTEAAEKKASDAMTRAEAEIDAVRERLQRDLERRVMQGKAGLLTSMLEVIDNLDRAARHAEATSTAMGEGLDLVRQQMLAILKTEGVEPIETLGAAYDPHVAEAVVTVGVGPESDGLVVEEIQRGYRYGETILRHARVKVGRA